MGSKAGAAGGAAATPPAVVCCMCGDHGLTQELFRCKACLVRSQHKYCSDLYPKAESYRACNWCLREEGGKALPKELVIIKDPSSSNPSTHNSEATAINGSNGGSGVKLHRGTFQSQLIKPIKKLRLLNRSASDVTDRMRTEELTPSIQARGRQTIRGKVRRYKLLEEVSS